MGFSLLIFLVFSGVATGGSSLISRKIQTVCPEVSPTILAILSEDIPAYRGTVPEDLIIAVAKVETNCTHPPQPGGHGELGLLQVIPADGHILSAMGDYECEAGNFESVRFNGVRLPVCAADGRLNVRAGKVISLPRAQAILRGSARIAFRIGILELQHWKARYEAEYVARYWAHRRILQATSAAWFTAVRRRLGSEVWVAHHNWGPRFISGNNYPLRIASEIEKIGGVL
jgi:hypothetical protein